MVEVLVEVLLSVTPGPHVDWSGRDNGVRTSGLDCPGLGDMAIGSSCDAVLYGFELVMDALLIVIVFVLR